MLSFRIFPFALSMLLTANAFVPITFTANKNVVSSTQRYSTAEAPALPDGLLKTVSKSGNGPAVKRGDVATVKYSCYLPDDATKIPFAKSDFQKVVIGDGTMIAGWETAIKTMREGERSVVRISNPELGYGSEGIPGILPPDADIEIDIEVLDVSAPLDNIDFDSLGFADPITPRTAGRIAEAYEEKMEAKSMEVELEGLEGWIETIKNYYFFGFFEGETGQQAPWFLRPSITFPIAFAIVGAAFAVSFEGGAIRERGAPSTDELDEFITVTQTVLSTNPSTLVALMFAGFGSDALPL